MTIDYVDMAVIEKVLIMGGGYVLDFSNNSFQKFIRDTVNVDIYADKYNVYGNSKAKRLKCYFDKSSTKECGNLLLNFLRYKQDVIGLKRDEMIDFKKCIEITNKISGKYQSTPSKIDKEDSQNKKPDYEYLKKELLELSHIQNRQQRGLKFEEFLKLLFIEYNLDPRPSFRIDSLHEQIDGSFIMDHETYLVEAKFKEKEIDYDELILFHTKLDERILARGIFISYSKISENAIEHLLMAKKTKIIILTIPEIFYILEKRYNLSLLLNLKLRKLNEEMKPFVNAAELL